MHWTYTYMYTCVLKLYKSTCEYIICTYIVSLTHDGHEQCYFHIVLSLVYSCSGGKVRLTKKYTRKYVLYKHQWIHVKSCRLGTTISDAMYNTPAAEEKARTLSSLLAHSVHASKGGKQHKESIHEPILLLEPSQLVIDELHLYLRVSDILLRNVIFQADTIDHRSRERTDRELGAVKKLAYLIQSCGVSFDIRHVCHDGTIHK